MIFAKSHLNKVKLLLSLLILGITTGMQAQIYTCHMCELNFISDAPLEIIQASSSNLQGVLDLDKSKFSFRIFIKSFDGFNSPLQKEHFNENYMEVNEFPSADFKGKILDVIDLTEKKTYRAKGVLTIHGRSQEVIITIIMWKNEEDKIQFQSDFVVPLADHNIEIPRIVMQKIAENIRVHAEGELNLRS